MLDWWGVTVGGVDEPVARLLRESGAEPDGPASVLGTDRGAPPVTAALWNGTASHALDYDDTVLALPGHVTAPLLPGLLALGETRGASGRVYPWGDWYNAHACNHGRLGLLPNDDSDGYAELAPVGAFPAGRTPDGILDLAGNVAEWQSDAYRERYQDPVPEENEGLRRVVRGGSFSSGGPWLRGAARDGAAPDTQRPDLGFRCARSAYGEETR